VGLVNRGDDPSLPKKDVPAWVSLPVPMPPLNSREFEKTTATIFIRKSFLDCSRYESVIQAIAHEMAHIVLEVRSEEPAVDLTAMWLGYRDIYVVGADYVEVGAPSRFSEKSIAEFRRYRSGDQIRNYTSLGYLSLEEVCFASRQMGWRSGYIPRPEPRVSARLAVEIVNRTMRAAPLFVIVLLAIVCWLFASVADGVAYFQLSQDPLFPPHLRARLRPFPATPLEPECLKITRPRSEFQISLVAEDRRSFSPTTRIG